jgi:hypothetical protein
VTRAWRLSNNPGRRSKNTESRKVVPDARRPAVSLDFQLRAATHSVQISGECLKDSFNPLGAGSQ